MKTFDFAIALLVLAVIYAALKPFLIWYLTRHDHKEEKDNAEIS